MQNGLFGFHGAGLRNIQDNLPFPSAAGGLQKYTHGINGIPSMVRVVLVNKQAELGYIPGDEVDIDSMADQNPEYRQACSIAVTDTHVNITGGPQDPYRMRHSTTGIFTNVTSTKWVLKFYAAL